MKKATERLTDKKVLTKNQLEELERLMRNAEEKGHSKIVVTGADISNEIINELLNLGYRIKVAGVMFPDGTFWQNDDTKITISW